MSNIFATISGLCGYRKPVTPEVKEPVVEALKVTNNGTYSKAQLTGTEVVNQDTVFDIPVVFDDGVVIKYKKLENFIWTDPLNINVNEHTLTLVASNSIGSLGPYTYPIRQLLGVDFTDSPGYSGKLIGFTSINIDIGSDKREKRLLMYIKYADGLVGTPYEGLFENDSVYVSDIFSHAGDDVTWEVSITAPTKDAIDGYLPITVQVPTGMFIKTFPNKIFYKVGESIDLTGGVLSVNTGPSVIDVPMTDNDGVFDANGHLIWRPIETPGLHTIKIVKYIDITTVQTTFQILVEEA